MLATGVRPTLRFRAAAGDDGPDILADPATGLARGCREARVYVVCVDVRGACRFWMDEVELEPIPQSPGTWSWEADFYAGEVEAELRDEHGKTVATWRVDVSPDPAKLGRDSYERMLDEVFALAPSLVLGNEASQTGIGVEGWVADPHLAYARLRRHGLAMAEAMRRLAQRPRACLTHRRARLPIHQVRRVDPAAVIGSLRQPGALSWLARDRSASARLDAFFDVSVTEESVDSPANRAMLWMLHAARKRVQVVRRELESLACRSGPSDAREALVARMPERHAFLDRIESQLVGLLRSHPFKDTTRREVSSAGLNAISADPLYARAYRRGWLALRSGIAGTRGDESLWSCPTWQIFERWCFVRTVEFLRRRLPSLKWTRRNVGDRLDAIAFTGASQGLTVQVFSQPRFAAFDQPSSLNFKSLSAERYPDIVVTVQDEDGSRFGVFDAKYRIARANVLEAMQSAHVYRDSLRWDGRRPTFAMLLTPAKGEAAWLESDDFRREHGVGVVPLTLDAGDIDLDLAMLFDTLFSATGALK